MTVLVVLATLRNVQTKPARVSFVTLKHVVLNHAALRGQGGTLGSDHEK